MDASKVTMVTTRELWYKLLFPDYLKNLAHTYQSHIDTQTHIFYYLKESTTEATEDEDAKSKSPTHRPFYSRTTSLLTMRPTKDHTPLYNRGFSLQREDGSIKNFMRYTIGFIFLKR